METPPRYSVVITAHNERASIRACLASLKAQTGLAPGAVEIILVDDRSTDGTAAEAIAADVAALRVIEISRLHDSRLTARQYALDAGFRAARGEVILTLDADGIAESDWIARAAGPILDGRVDAVAGPVSFRRTQDLVAAFQTVDVAFYLAVCRLLGGLGFEAGVLFGNFAFRAALYDQVGGFERMGFALTEDLAFARTLRRSGRRIAYLGGRSLSVRACPNWAAVIERSKRVSAGGPSALSAVLGIWMISLAIFLGAATLFGGPALDGLAMARYGAGIAFVAAALLRTGQARLLPLALFYEPVTIMIGFLVIWRLMRDRRVEWGGVGYRR